MLHAMTPEEAHPGTPPRTPDTLALIGPEATHRDAEQALLAAGWTPCGAGDWAIALRSPDGTAAARISPFDPTGPYSASLYREAAHTRQVPELFAHRRLSGGGDLQLMEWLRPVPQPDAAASTPRPWQNSPGVAPWTTTRPTSCAAQTTDL
jgi:hypothetical protein